MAEVDDAALYFGAIVDFFILCGFSFLGASTNVINLLVFARQGFRDEVNISLSAIASWDLIKCSCFFAHTLGLPLGWLLPALGASWRNISQMFFVNIVSFSGYVSYALASYVSVERCLCVGLPFTVKSIFTPRFSLVMVSSISVIVVGLNLIVFFVTDIVYVYSPQYNSTIAVLKFNSLYFLIQGPFVDGIKAVRIMLTFLPFIILCLSSALTLFFLKKASNNIRSSKISKLSSLSRLTKKEKQVSKMLLVILVFFIGNLFPRIIFYVAQFSEPEFYYAKKYNTAFNMTFSCMLILDFVNHSSNLFIFLKMSSNFRSTFRTMFPMCVKDEDLINK